MLPTKEQIEEWNKDPTFIDRFDPNEELPLFVIGAGASIEFGYPSGEKLKEQIKGILDPNSEEFKKIDLYSLCSKELEKQEFINACETIRKTIDFHSTIDDCIKFYIENKKVELVGKLAITKLIADLGFNEKSLFDSKNELRINNSWLDSFFKFVKKHLKIQDVESRINRIPITTFNYDRNIEKYMNYICGQIFERNIKFPKIIHIYGSLPEESDFVKENENLINWSKNIKTYAELEYKYEDRRNYRYCDYETKSIIFLGFGYDEINMKLLARPMNREIKRKIFGTIYNSNEDLKEMDEDSKENIINKLSNIFNANKDNIHLYNTTCKDFFNKFSSIEDFL
jgi:hypothetical protein